jgi:hypothetical protein
MSKSNKGDLFQLIRTLSKAEKRHFRLYIQRQGSADDKLYVRLFNALDSMREFNEQKLSVKLPDIDGRRLINLKRHLHQVLLKSLRLMHSTKRADIYISEHIDYARILYSKGQYLQSLKILERLLPIAEKAEESILQLEIMEFEKFIESRHITRSRRVKNKVEALIQRSSKMSTELLTTVELSNFSLKVHGYYIQNGFVRSKNDVIKIVRYFKEHTIDYNKESLGFADRIYLNQAYMWYYYWVELFRIYPEMKKKDPDPFLRGMHYLLLSCFYARDKKKYNEHYKALSAFLKKYAKDFSTTSNMLLFVYQTNALLNKHILNGDYKKALELTDNVLNGISHYGDHMDEHRKLIFYYKIAWLHYGRNEYSPALDMLNLIIHRKTQYLREDLKCFASLLHVLIHTELGHYDLAKSLLRSVTRTFKKSGHEGKLIHSVLKFIADWINDPDQLSDNAKEFNENLKDLAQDDFDRRSFTYFNFEAWSKALSLGTTIEKVVRMD